MIDSKVHFMPKLTIRTKLLILFSLIFTFAFAVFGILAYLRVSEFARELAKSKLQSDANAITDSTAANVYGEDALALHDAWLDNSLTNDLELVTLYNDLFQQTEDLYPDLDLQFTVTYVEEAERQVVRLMNFEGGSISEPAEERTIEDNREWATLLEARDVATQYPIDEADGSLTMSSSAPLRDPSGEPTGAVLNVFLNADNQLARVQRDIRNTLLISALIIYPLLLVAVLLVAYSATRVLNQFTSAATTLEHGQPYDSSVLAMVKERGDELGQLARVFDKMALEVQAREEKLKQEVVKLKIEIDVAKQNKEVSEIVDSDYFRDLKAKKEELKAGTGSHAKAPPAASAEASPAPDDYMASLKQKAAGMKKTPPPRSEITTDPYIALLRDEAPNTPDEPS
jgi:methyl-accepting chemotaxis protein